MLSQRFTEPPRQHSGPDTDSLREGPVKKRQCTDVLFALLFVFFWVASTYFLWRYIMTADFSILTQPYDSEGNACGQATSQRDLTQYPYLFFNFTEQENPDASIRYVCVKYCPTREDESIPCYRNKYVTSCSQLSSYPTEEFLVNFCGPTEGSKLTAVSKLLGGFSIQTILTSIYINRMVLISCVGIAFLLSFVLTFFLEYSTKTVIVASIVGTCVIGTGMAVFSFRKYSKLKTSATSGSTTSQSQLADATFYLFLTIGMGCCILIMFTILLHLRKRIILAIQVIQATGEFIGGSKETVFTPIIFLVVGLVYMGWWLFGLLGIFAHGTVRYIPGSPWGKVGITQNMILKLYLHTASAFWNISFFMAASHFIIACATAHWYFDKERTHEKNPLVRSAIWAFRYHLGSIAFGSALLAIMWPIRVISQFVYERLRECMEKRKRCCLFACCLKCFMVCVGGFVRCFNKHAYVEIALRSKNFCASSCTGFRVVSNNFMKYGILHGLGEIVLNTVVFFITVTGVSIGYFLLTFFGPENPELQGMAGCLVIIAFVMWVVGTLFCQVWEVGADSILHCHCIDEEIEGGRARQSTQRLNKILVGAERGSTARPSAPEYR